MQPARVLRFLRRVLAGTPAERKQAMYLLWMASRGIDLTLVTLEDLQLSPKRSYWHANSGGPDLDLVLRSIPISAADSVLDFGCGKGGAMITIARYGCARVDGVELSPDLVKIAKRNFKRLGITGAEITCCDAAEFTALDRYTVLYFFNPFPTIVMGRVLANIRASLSRKPRRLIIIYKNPLDHDLISSSSFHKILEFHHSSHAFYVYTNAVDQPGVCSVRLFGHHPGAT